VTQSHQKKALRNIGVEEFVRRLRATVNRRLVIRGFRLRESSPPAFKPRTRWWSAD
jgi:hypothetical protein